MDIGCGVAEQVKSKHQIWPRYRIIISILLLLSRSFSAYIDFQSFG